MSSIYVNETIRLKVTFYEWDDSQDPDEIEDPDTVVYNIYDETASPTLLATGTPVRESAGIYYYDWTPSVEGDYIFTFVGTFADDTTDVVTTHFEVLGIGATTSGTTLVSDEVITFGGIITPLCINPDELLVIFPDATELDVAEALWRASTEMYAMLGLSSDDVCPTTPVALDYIKAAAACELSRVFELGDGNEQSMMLGDFSVTYRSFPKSSVNRGNATTWCELAAALRNEVIYKTTYARAFVAGSVYDNPIPQRKLDRVVRSNSSTGTPLMIDPTNPNDPTRDFWNNSGTQKQGLLDGEPS